MTVITTILALLIIPIPLKQIQAGGYGIFSLFRKPRFFYKRTAMLFVTSLLFVGHDIFIFWSHDTTLHVGDLER